MDHDDVVGAMDPTRPWTIKAISIEVRDMAIGAARKEGLTVGQWLEKRVREWCGDSNGQPGSALVVHAGGQVAPATMVAKIEATSQLVRLAIEIAGLPADQKDDPLVKNAKTSIRSALSSLR
jgi:hypothetical protein